jgi:hypothetical protein
VHLERVPLGAVAIELLFSISSCWPCGRTSRLAALALAARAFDAQHIELSLDVTEYEIRSSHVG